jgi:phycocyanin-associated, rod
MLGQSRFTRDSGSISSHRMFVYEVAGLRQNEQTENNSYAVRESSNILIQVPYDRMNHEMRRITRLGGKIVGIQPLGSAKPQVPSASVETTSTSEAGSYTNSGKLHYRSDPP